MQDWKRSFNAIWIAQALAIAGFATSAPIIPLFIHSIGVEDPAALNFWTGLTQAVSSIAMAVMAPIWGSLADSYGRRPMVLRAMIGGAILIGLLGITTSPWQVLVLRTLQGAFTGTVAASTVLTASMVPAAEVGYRLGLLQMAVYLGNSLGPLFGGVVADTLGLRVNFAATSGLLVIAAIIVATSVKEDFVPQPRSGSMLRNAVPDFSALKSAPMLGSLLSVVFAVQFAAAVVMPMLPLHIMEMTGTGTGAGSLSGAIIAAGSLSGALAAAAIGKVSGKIGYGRTLVFCLAGATAFYVPQGFVTTPWALLALRLGSGFFLGGTMPSVNALIAALADRSKQGSTYGLSSTMSSAGAALGPAIGASLATLTGYRSVFFATSAILGGISLSVASSVRRRANSGGQR